MKKPNSAAAIICRALISARPIRRDGGPGEGGVALYHADHIQGEVHRGAILYNLGGARINNEIRALLKGHNGLGSHQASL
ncbi:MAG: hypothetical protein ABI165_13745 [Bryobacteraceae bacterium]